MDLIEKGAGLVGEADMQSSNHSLVEEHEDRGMTYGVKETVVFAQADRPCIEGRRGNSVGKGMEGSGLDGCVAVMETARDPRIVGGSTEEPRRKIQGWHLTYLLLLSACAAPCPRVGLEHHLYFFRG